MPRFAANLHYLFNELPFMQRFEAAASIGFKAVEFQVPYDWPADELAAALRQYGLEMVLIDTPQGDWSAGERGLAALPGRQQEFRDNIAPTVSYCKAMGCTMVHVIAGVLPTGADIKEAERIYVENLRYAADKLEAEGITAVIEPINRQLDLVKNSETYTTLGMHGFFLNDVRQAVDFIARANCPNLFLHLDLYHQQLTGGRLAETLQQDIGIIRHIQFAGVPGRHEPDVGEINYPYLFDLIDSLGYDGWIGCEYRPAGKTIEGLAWAKKYQIGLARESDCTCAASA
jgi:hydroxypyruvate isomerase